MTQQEIQSAITYNPDTGEVHRIHAISNKIKEKPHKGMTLLVNNNQYSIFTCLWLYYYGVLPSSAVFTVNGDNTDWRIANLSCMKTGYTTLTPELLKQYLNYNPDTGIFTYIARPSASAKVGAIAGSVRGTLPDGGYIGISLLGKVYSAHRLAFLYMTGEWPINQIDHIDHDRTNNAWNNLRLADSLDNSRNKSLYKNNKSGCPNVHHNGYGWQARINGVDKIFLGTFNTYEEAVAAKKGAERVLKYHANHGNKSLTTIPEGSTSQANGDGNGKDPTM